MSSYETISQAISQLEWLKHISGLIILYETVDTRPFNVYVITKNWTHCFWSKEIIIANRKITFR